MKKKYKYLICFLFSFFILFPSYLLAKIEDTKSTINTLGIPENQKPKKVYTGKAMWYGKAFHGKKMANGEKFDMYNENTAAHRRYKFGTKLKVTNMANGKYVYVVVKDRGPFSYKSVENSSGEKIKKYSAELDLSYAGAKAIGIDKAGIGDVKIEVY
ncbi:MAG: septal ring lytic transglycosylase RlpA family protein [Patescibacteria group bacterium]|nr:septal ring lytic transglycosylase RlpA family protein [Patescibacteria group bacterium]MDD4304262.1 septal ring lytic transglycosylase RlpA family protein [Patescibacteria group bacterium]MDD4695316.1 septal ring lytic transglycosylase RlpA family protein [Patescibacteria group bacterium]